MYKRVNPTMLNLNRGKKQIKMEEIQIRNGGFMELKITEEQKEELKKINIKAIEEYEKIREKYFKRYDEQYRLHCHQLRGMETYYNEMRMNWIETEGYEDNIYRRMAINRWDNILQRKLLLLSGAIGIE